jgi:prepilin-type N-terminal cleavage/methylation domain-containing protein
MNNSPRRLFIRRQSGFSLVEMIGVLAIIAILAVVIVPKVFSTIASSRITNAVGSVTSIKSAVAEFAGKHGTVPFTNANSRIDDLLVATGFLESRFSVKIGTQPTAATPAPAVWAATAPWTPYTSAGNNQGAQSRIICIASNVAGVPGTNGNNYHLDGSTSLPAGSRVISAVITGLTANESRELSLRIDGDAFTPNATGIADTRGKVTYAAAGTTAFIYVAHQ